MSSKIITRISAVALGAAMIVSAAACGTSNAGSSSRSSSSAADKGVDVSSVKKDDAIAALLPSSVTKDGTLTIGTDTSYAPAEFLDADGKTPIGFDVDLGQAIANVFGLKRVTVSSTFDSIIPSVGSKYDIGMSSFTVTKERLAAVDFVTYFNAGSTFVVQKGNPKKIDTDNLCGAKLAVQTGTTQESAAHTIDKQCTAAGKKSIQIQSFKAQTDVTTAVASGKSDIFYADTPVAGYAIVQTNNTLQTIGKDVDVTPEGIVVKKGDTATAQAVQKAVQKLIDDGTYEKVLSHWGVASGAIDKAEINPSVE
ncbi:MULTISPECIES: ABC transporter substrate-binding protein [Bifidobacterium]|uniref:ABC transporter substrate-binding protein n=1 Tax=Bifidobacterium tibiigranuli TaxID=2172043 RepID=A0A5N6S0P2_9BIFI|nr:ABC transporter substrate-binding protein [Bifidobacterium tibiigranuli]KAE8128115.1 ABC transporter substrate-binding protein [Bifidobacterium tibiigranuli]KAE8128276.1 ABC transporter substrate-binding protein [Bifidobacterium tibiigranuli]